MFNLSILAPKTKTAAVIVLVSCVAILISYYIWPLWFLNASVWIAILAPLAIFLMAVFALALYTVMYLSNALPKLKEVQKKVDETNNADIVIHDNIYNMSWFYMSTV